MVVLGFQVLLFTAAATTASLVRRFSLQAYTLLTGNGRYWYRKETRQRESYQ
jgi:hypothetical protein